MATYVDEAGDKILEKQMSPADLLLGRKTFDIFTSYWPQHADNWPGINEVNKYVVSRTHKKSDWMNSVFLKGLADIKKLKKPQAAYIKVWGSTNLVQILLKDDLLNESWLNNYPITLGKGKKLFDKGTTPAAFTLTESFVTPGKVIMAHCKRAGKINTGTVGA